MSLPASLANIPSTLQTWASNFQRNATASFTNLKPKDYIRIIIIVGAYSLIVRPMLARLGSRIQAKQHSQSESDPSSTEQSNEAVGIAALDPDSESDDDGGKGRVRTGEWGRKARLRQRRFLRKALEVDDGGADDSDEEIKEFLVD
jgi:hypothetical protein